MLNLVMTCLCGIFASQCPLLKYQSCHSYQCLVMPTLDYDYFNVIYLFEIFLHCLIIPPSKKKTIRKGDNKTINNYYEIKQNLEMPVVMHYTWGCLWRKFRNKMGEEGYEVGIDQILSVLKDLLGS